MYERRIRQNNNSDGNNPHHRGRHLHATWKRRFTKAAWGHLHQKRQFRVLFPVGNFDRR